LPIAGEHQVRVRIDEARHDSAPARVEPNGLVVELEFMRCFRRRADVDDDAVMRGDRCVANWGDVALCRAAPGDGTCARCDEARVLDHEVGGDGHEVSLIQNAKCKIQTVTARDRR
jgi:hypothetical protein